MYPTVADFDPIPGHEADDNSDSEMCIDETHGATDVIDLSTDNSQTDSGKEVIENKSNGSVEECTAADQNFVEVKAEPDLSPHKMRQQVKDPVTAVRTVLFTGRDSGSPVHMDVANALTSTQFSPADSSASSESKSHLQSTPLVPMTSVKEEIVQEEADDSGYKSDSQCSPTPESEIKSDPVVDENRVPDQLATSCVQEMDVTISCEGDATRYTQTESQAVDESANGSKKRKCEQNNDSASGSDQQDKKVKKDLLVGLSPDIVSLIMDFCSIHVPEHLLHSK